MVAPRQIDQKSILLRYAALFLVVVTGTIAIVFTATTGFFTTESNAAPAVAPSMANGGKRFGAVKAMWDTVNAASSGIPESAIVFLCGGHSSS